MLRRRMMMQSENSMMPEGGIIYKLPEKTIFTGSNNIDTGIHLFRDYDSFTLFSEIEFDTNELINPVPTDAENATIFTCMWEQKPWPGFSYRIRNGYTTDIIFGDSSPIVLISGGKGKYKIKIAFTTNNKTVTKMLFKTNDEKYKTFSTVYQWENPGGIDNAVLILGSYKTTSGTYGRYFKGSINIFSLYDRAFSDEEIEKFFV